MSITKTNAQTIPRHCCLQRSHHPRMHIPFCAFLPYFHRLGRKCRTTAKARGAARERGMTAARQPLPCSVFPFSSRPQKQPVSVFSPSPGSASFTSRVKWRFVPPPSPTLASKGTYRWKYSPRAGNSPKCGTTHISEKKTEIKNRTSFQKWLPLLCFQDMEKG